MSSDNRIPQMGTTNGQKVKRLGCLAGLLAIVVAAGCGGSSTNTNGNGGGGPLAASIRGSIAVGIAPSAIAVDSITNKVYVADFGTMPTTPASGHGCTQSGADLTAIDGATQSTTSTGFSFNTTPYSIALNATSHTLYVLTKEYWSGINQYGSCGVFDEPLELFDTTTFKEDGKVVRAGGTRVNVNSTTNNVYVGAGDVTAGDVNAWDSNWNLVATIAVATNPEGVAVNTTTNKIYVANYGSNNISVIDGASNSVVATITDPNGVAPIAVAVNPTTNVIYVANSQSNNVTVIDGATGSVTATIPVGTSPSGLDADSQTNFIYVANAGNSQAGDPGNVTVISGATHATATLTDPKATNPVAVAVNPVTNKIYVANSGSNNVTVIDGAHD